MGKGWAYEEPVLWNDRGNGIEGKGIERTNEREKERKRDSIQSAEALTQRGKSPKRKPLTTSTGWKKNRLRESRRGYVGRFSTLSSSLSLSLSFSYSIFPPCFLFLCLRPALSAFVNVSSFLQLLSARFPRHAVSITRLIVLPHRSQWRPPLGIHFPGPVNRIATFRGIWRDYRAKAKARG